MIAIGLLSLAWYLGQKFVGTTPLPFLALRIFALLLAFIAVGIVALDRAHTAPAFFILGNSERHGLVATVNLQKIIKNHELEQPMRGM